MCLVFVYPQRLDTVSMGPCPFRHGYKLAVRCLSRRFGSFNGAMPFQAWIHPPGSTRVRAVEQLQWGHALSGMDTKRAAKHDPRKRRLQWGHALSGMDTGALGVESDFGQHASMGPCPFRHGYYTSAVDRHTKHIASMGPCPFRHGYKCHRSGTSRCSTLQWGHALSGMDTNATAPGRAAAARFNGAMPFQAWIHRIRSAVERETA